MKRSGLELDQGKVDAANRLLAVFAPYASLAIGRRPGDDRLLVAWRYHGKSVIYEWEGVDQSGLMPRWRRLWPGNRLTLHLLGMLARWVLWLTVLPSSAWRRLAGRWMRHRAGQWEVAIRGVEAAGYPSRVACVICGKDEPEVVAWCPAGRHAAGPSHTDSIDCLFRIFGDVLCRRS